MAYKTKYRVYLDTKINKYRVAIFNFKGEPVDHFTRCLHRSPSAASRVSSRPREPGCSILFVSISALSVATCPVAEPFRECPSCPAASECEQCPACPSGSGTAFDWVTFLWNWLQRLCCASFGGLIVVISTVCRRPASPPVRALEDRRARSRVASPATRNNAGQGGGTEDAGY